MKVWVVYQESGSYSSYTMEVLSVHHTRDGAMNSIKPVVDRMIKQFEDQNTYSDEWARERTTHILAAWQNATWKENDAGCLNLSVMGFDDEYTVAPFEVEP